MFASLAFGEVAMRYQLSRFAKGLLPFPTLVREKRPVTGGTALRYFKITLMRPLLVALTQLK